MIKVLILMNKYFYIYNQRQADFFYKSGLEIIEIGRGKQGDTFIKFEKNEESQKVFTEWMNKKDDELLK